MIGRCTLRSVFVQKLRLLYFVYGSIDSVSENEL